MNELINRMTDYLGPALASTVGHALIGLIILIVGLLIVKFIVGVFSRVLKKVDFLYRSNADGTTTDLASPIASLLKGVLTIFVLMAVLQHFGLTDVLAPLREMVSKFTVTENTQVPADNDKFMVV